MARLTRVVASFGRTIPLPIDDSGRNFAYKRADYEAEAALEPGDDVAAVAAALWRMVRTNVNAQLDPAVKTADGALRRIWLGLPEDAQALFTAALTPAQARAIAGDTRGGVVATDADGVAHPLSTAALDAQGGEA